MFMTYRNQRPTRPGYYWHRCADPRTTERIVLVNAEVLADWQRTGRYHLCPLCEFAGPVDMPCDDKKGSIEQGIKQILNTPFWPDTVVPKVGYFRTQDDCEGDRNNGLGVRFSEDGDAWVRTPNEGCRFRTHFGGGLSLRVRNALLVLAVAIAADNADRPIS
jgi:hypothetical protein